jgi:hypothetical protein
MVCVQNTKPPPILPSCVLHVGSKINTVPCIEVLILIRRGVMREHYRFAVIFTNLDTFSSPDQELSQNH